jgi:tetratricopeptide (TPR) repeat protein
MTPIQRIVCTAAAATALGGLVAAASAEMGPLLPPSAVAPMRQSLAADQQRGEELERIAQQADQRTRHGCELAGRGAFYAARGELLAALRLLADGLDAQGQTDAHGSALGRALTAMNEAEDFLPANARPLTAAEVQRLIAAHETPALKEASENVTALVAMKSYLTYAQGQFALAAGEEVAGSMALRALGKLYDTMAAKKHPTETAAAAKAIVFYQAALLTQPDNFMAANDLGVLLARAGDLRAAQKMLEYSLECGGQAATWRNLAVVHRRLGQIASAEWCERQALAREQYEINRQGGAAIAAGGAVRWIDPYSFAGTSLGGPAYPNPAARPEMAGQAPSRAATGYPYGRAAAPNPAAAQRLTWGTPTR